MSDLIKIYKIPKEKKKESLLFSLLTKTTSVEYDKLPNSFTTLDKWPEKSNLLCVNCGCSTLRRPFFVPHQETDTGEILRGGNPMTCSPNCALFVIRIRIKDKYEYSYKYKLITRLAFLMTGLPNIVVFLPDDPAHLVKHGGSLDDKSYQKKIYNLNPELITALYSDSDDMIKETQS